jgi:hypothetical protein
LEKFFFYRVSTAEESEESWAIKLTINQLLKDVINLIIVFIVDFARRLERSLFQTH